MRHPPYPQQHTGSHTADSAHAQSNPQARQPLSTNKLSFLGVAPGSRYSTRHAGLTGLQSDTHADSQLCRYNSCPRQIVSYYYYSLGELLAASQACLAPVVAL